MDHDVEVQIRQDMDYVLELELAGRKVDVSIRFDQIRGRDSLRLLLGRKPVANLTTDSDSDGEPGVRLEVGTRPTVTTFEFDRETGQFLRDVLLNHRRVMEIRRKTEARWGSEITEDPSALVNNRSDTESEDVRSILKHRAQELTRHRYNYTRRAEKQDESGSGRDDSGE